MAVRNTVGGDGAQFVLYLPGGGTGLEALTAEAPEGVHRAVNLEEIARICTQGSP
jgi:hypothetical protein